MDLCGRSHDLKITHVEGGRKGDSSLMDVITLYTNLAGPAHKHVFFNLDTVIQQAITYIFQSYQQDIALAKWSSTLSSTMCCERQRHGIMTILFQYNFRAPATRSKWNLDENISNQLETKCPYCVQQSIELNWIPPFTTLPVRLC